LNIERGTSNATQVPPSDWTGRSWLLYGTVRELITLIVWSGLIRVRVRGAGNVPSTGPAVLIANHQSNLDPLLIGWSIARPITIPGKIELFRIPVLPKLLRGLGCFPVDREIADAGSLRRSLLMLRQDRLLAVFPEGTRSRSGEIGPFGPTLTKVAIRERVPIVPIAVAGTARILAPGQITPKFGARVGIRVGSPFELGDYYGAKLGNDDLARATEKVRGEVTSLYEEAQLLAAGNRGG